ncbi:hypothetical protein [Streptomyces lasiicapitis]|uniref:hypothetical protein n=1 Tax=Streptomyces lasiicapitis TaxID=1923961 RepID=UPI0036525A3C
MIPDQYEAVGPDGADVGVVAHVQESFDRRGLMAQLGARITRIGPGRVRIVLAQRTALGTRPETEDRGQ